MSIASVILDGFGAGGSEALLILDGFVQAPPPPIARTLVLDGLGGSVSSLIHEGFSGVTGLIDPPPSGKQYADLTTLTFIGDSLEQGEPGASPALVAGDVFIVDRTTLGTGYPILVNGDGTVSINAGGDKTRQSFQADIYSPTTLTTYGVFRVTVNDSAPQINSQPADINALVGDTISLDFIGGGYVSDQDGDPLTATLTSGSITGTGLTLSSAGLLSGTAAGAISNPITVTFTDPSGLTVAVTLNLVIQVGIVVPNCVGLTQAAALTAETAAGFANGTNSFAYDLNIPAGSVISQSPAAGAVVSPTSGPAPTFTTTMSLQISLGPQPPSGVATGGVPAQPTNTLGADPAVQIQFGAKLNQLLPNGWFE